MVEMGRTQGNAGNIEWMVDRSDSDKCFILCHPHPLYGGSMLDGVLESASRVLHELDYSVIRFNFRGVGASEGDHDHGKGEVDDLSVIVGEFQADFEQTSLGGYSFGASVVLSYLADASIIDRVLLFAPPTYQPLPAVSLETHVIVGENDEISSANTLKAWASKSEKVSIHEIQDADHFIAANNREIKMLVSEILTQ